MGTPHPIADFTSTSRVVTGLVEVAGQARRPDHQGMETS